MNNQQDTNQRQLVISSPQNVPSTLTIADEKLIAFVEDKLQQCNSLDEYREVFTFLTEVKKSNIQLHFDTHSQSTELSKKRTDLFFYRLQRGLTITIGVGLFVSSFFIFSINPVLGGVFFGTGLGALGIGTISLKSLLNK